MNVLIISFRQKIVVFALKSGNVCLRLAQVVDITPYQRKNINRYSTQISSAIFFYFILDIEAQIADIQSKKKELTQAQANEKGVSLLESGYFDSDLYDENTDRTKRYEGYMTSIPANEDVDDDDDDGLPITNKRSSYTAPKSILKDVIKQVSVEQSRFFSESGDKQSTFTLAIQGDKDEPDPFADRRRPTIADREDEYRQKRRRLVISPERADPFADG